jgi:LAO/AO transport system kinase
MNDEQVRRFQARRRASMPVSQLVEGVLAGDRAILSRAITLVESSLPSDQEKADELLEACIKRRVDSIRVGITGVPGAGKSTFVDALGTYLTRGRGEKVAVLAVDPSSPVTGGSILGDKTRMPRLSLDENAFIRPTPSRGSLGGVSWRTRETILLCEAAGFNNILVETVGVGQSETAVASMTDFFLLLLIAGGGDELQGIKRGIIEMTDLLAINKADGENVARAQAARQEYKSAMRLFPPTSRGWQTRVVTCSALMGEGISEIWDIVGKYREQMTNCGKFRARRADQAKRAMYASIEHELVTRFFADPDTRAKLAAAEQDVVEGRLSSYRAARQLLNHRKPE